MTPMRDSLKFFSNEMEKRLVENDNKIPWENVSGTHLYNRAIISIAKSWDEALSRIMANDGRGITDDILNGFVDAANYCMMIYTMWHPETCNNINGHKQEKE